MEDGSQSQQDPSNETEFVVKKEPTYEELQRVANLDPDGGYADPLKGLEAEKKAMVTLPELHVNALPTKMYLDATVVPVVMQALA